MKEINDLIDILKRLILIDPELRCAYYRAKGAFQKLNIIQKLQAAEKLKETFL